MNPDPASIDQPNHDVDPASPPAHTKEGESPAVSSLTSSELIIGFLLAPCHLQPLAPLARINIFSNPPDIAPPFLRQQRIALPVRVEPKVFFANE